MPENEKLESSTGQGDSRTGKKRGKMMLAGLVLGVMVVEGLMIFALVKGYTAKPQEANASQGLDAHAGQKAPTPAEAQVVQFRAQNDRSQRMTVYDLTVSVVSTSDKIEELKLILEQRKDTIRDRFTRVVRSLDPTRFQEADLATLRSQFRTELNQIVGEDQAVKEVLIPSIIAISEQ